MTQHWSNDGIRASLDLMLDRIDAGAGAGLVRIYSGAVPADVGVALGAQVLLAELAFSDPAFDPSVDSNPGATATADPITDEDAALANGTASFFRIVDSNGVGVYQGLTSDDGSGDLDLSTVEIATGVIVGITTMTVFMAESAA